jgi:PelA/Pel-15E family pectate lyase
MNKICFVSLGLLLLFAVADAPAADKVSRAIAETLLLYQRDNGGWPKNFEWDESVDDRKKKELLRQKQQNDTTIDNGATHKEIRYLARAYASLKDERLRQAALKGIAFLLDAQYDNGGWPQYYPGATGYHRHITFNDSAMIGVMSLFRDIVRGKAEFGFVAADTRQKAAKAVKKGIHCILKCQIVVKGKNTVWCAQHDAKTLEPSKARSYELASLSGAESVKIVRFLMAMENPTSGVTSAIESAVAWFEMAKIPGIRLERVQDLSKPGGRDRIVVRDASAPPMWARFYEIESNRPIFCSRDGVPKYRLSEISHERRNGYSWLGTYADSLLNKEITALKLLLRRAYRREVLGIPGFQIEAKC